MHVISNGGCGAVGQSGGDKSRWLAAVLQANTSAVHLVMIHRLDAEALCGYGKKFL